MKKLAMVMMLASIAALVGCTVVQSPVVGYLVTQTKGPVSGVDNSVAPTKTGVAECQGIICVAIGDASIKAAMEDGDITKIHHVDHESLGVLGIFSSYKTIVYGE